MSKGSWCCSWEKGVWFGNLRVSYLFIAGNVHLLGSSQHIWHVLEKVIEWRLSFLLSDAVVLSRKKLDFFLWVEEPSLPAELFKRLYKWCMTEQQMDRRIAVCWYDNVSLSCTFICLSSCLRPLLYMLSQPIERHNPYKIRVWIR